MNHDCWANSVCVFQSRVIWSLPFFLSLQILSNHSLDLGGGGQDIAYPRYSLNAFSGPHYIHDVATIIQVIYEFTLFVVFWSYQGTWVRKQSPALIFYESGLG